MSTQRSSVAASPRDKSADADPQKQTSPTGHSNVDLSGTKFDAMMEMLRRLETRSNDVNTLRNEIRDEMRASSARLDQRLSAMESQHRETGPMTPSTLEENRARVEDWQASTSAAREAGMRIPTEVAVEFYRGAQQATEEDQATSAAVEGQNGHQGMDVGEAEGENGTDADTIKNLKEENRKLVQLMGGFAEKLQWLEEKMRKEGS